MEKRVDKVNIYLLMEMYMKASGLKIKRKVKELCVIHQVLYLRVLGSKIKLLAREL